jgi:hypothetical protein
MKVGGCFFFNEALMDEETTFVVERRKWEKVGHLMCRCVRVFVCCRLMKIGIFVLWVVEDMLWQQKSGLVCCDANNEFLLWKNLQDGFLVRSEESMRHEINKLWVMKN